MKGSSPKLFNAGNSLSIAGLSPMIAAAHELKAPLALVRQLSLYLKTDTIPQAERERLLHQITLTTERALRLTNDLSRVARLEDSIFDVEPINPLQICDDVARELSPLFIAKHSALTVPSRRRPLTVVANRQLLHRVIANFADNALHYSDTNEPVLLQVGAHDKGKIIRLAVRDYGPAIPVDIWQRLTRDLGRTTQSLQNRPQSSGLGLYVAGQFAHAMRGTIGAIRHRDGATFYIDLDASMQLKLL